MFDDVLNRKDVQDVLKQIFNNPKYYNKKQEAALENTYVLQERVLFIFYSSIYKYKLIIEDDFYLDKYITAIDILFKKIDDIENIQLGISKLLGSLIMQKLSISEDEYDKALEYAYEKYVKNGYYIRGLNRIDFESNDNIYYELEQLKSLLEKYDYNILENNEIVYNTDFVKGCLNSINSPDFLYKLSYNDKCPEAYYLKDFDLCRKNLNRNLNDLEVSDLDKKEINSLFVSIWNYYNNEGFNIYLGLIKRDKVKAASDYVVNNELNFEEALYNIFTTFEDYSNTSVEIELDELVTLPYQYGYVKKYKKDKKREIVDDGFWLDNKYGRATIFLIAGSISIILGVIFAIILN